MFGLCRRRLQELLRQAADSAQRARNWKKSSILYGITLKLMPSDARIWVQLGHALKERGDMRGARHAYERACDVDGHHVDGAFHLGCLLKELGEPDAAAASLQKAIDKLADPCSSQPELSFQVRVALADIRRDQGDWAAAAEHYATALALYPDRAAIRVQLGNVLKEAGRLADSEAAYRAVLRAEPASAEAWLQLGHVLKVQGRRTEAVRAYCQSLAEAPGEDAAHALCAAVGYSPYELRRVRADRPMEQLGDFGMQADAFLGKRSRIDILWFPNIEWHFRKQRPQHLARALAALGARIAYVSQLFDTAAEPSFRVIGAPHPGVIEIRLGFPGGESAGVGSGIPVAPFLEALAILEKEMGFGRPVLVVQEPSWEEALRHLPGRRVVYDCVDLLPAFEGADAGRLRSERALLQRADAVVVTSRPLSETLAGLRPVLIRNGVWVDDFRAPAASVRNGRPRLGYVGAVREWFRFEWISHCAVRHPEWQFEIVGRVEAPVPREARLRNITFLGERPYEQLPDMLAGFDVALIPFENNALTLATNAVKLYEYLAAGKPVVATALPENEAPGDLVYLARDAAEFEAGIGKALGERDPILASRRMQWAARNGWNSRARQFLSVLDPESPLPQTDL